MEVLAEEKLKQEVIDDYEAEAYEQEEEDDDDSAELKQEWGGNDESENEELEEEYRHPVKSKRRKKVKLKEEIDDDDGELIFCCFVCNKKFKSERGLGKHLTVHTEQDQSNEFCCHECGQVFSSRSRLTVHLKSHSVKRIPARNTKLNCPVCDKVLTSKLGLQIHVQRHTSLKLDPTGSTKPVATFVPVDEGSDGDGPGGGISIKLEDEVVDYRCLVCGKEHTCKSDLVEHMKVHTNRLKYECPVCNRKLSTKGALTVHMRIHMDNAKPHVCAECGKRFRAKGNMMEHQRTHRDSRSFECTYCDKSFKQRSNLTVHLLLIHGDSAARRIAAGGGQAGSKSGELDEYSITTSGADGEKQIMYRCPMCDKTLASKRGLSIHMQLHVADGGMTRDPTGESGEILTPGEVKTLYECYVCFKLLASRTGLEKHLLTHSDENKSLACTKCDKRFRDTRSLMAHERIHTGEKPFHCSYCEKKYAQRSNLITHLLLSHGVRTTKGNRSITVASMIPRFSSIIPPPPIVAEGSGNHLCSICAKQFSTSAALAAHERVHVYSKPQDEINITELLAADGTTTCCQCLNCEEMFVSLLAFNEHTCEQPDQNQTLDDIQLVHMCTRCGEQFENETLLTNHTCGGTTYCCGLCGKCYKDKTMLALHACDQSSGDPVASLVCQVCSAACSTHEEFQAHLQTHVAVTDSSMILPHPSRVPTNGIGDARQIVEDNSCWQCGTSFASSEELAVHAAMCKGAGGGEVLEGGETLMCEACGASFDSEEAARHHVEVEHDGAKAAVADALYVCAEYDESATVEHVQE